MYSGTADRRGNWAYSGTMRAGGEAAAAIGLSNSSIAEDVAAGANVGTLSVVNATGTPIFTLIDNAGNRFALNVDGVTLERGASGLNYEASQLHYITVSVSGMTPSPPDRVVTIHVTNILEVTLGALNLETSVCDSDDPEGTVIGAIMGASGGTVTLHDAASAKAAKLDNNIVVGSAAPLAVGTFDITLRETHADGVNSPLDTILTITVTDITAPTITSANTANNVEGVVLAHALTANESVTWTITGGDDQARFEISGSTLRWVSNGVKDFETPDDVDTSNTYVVQITASDALLNASNQTITVTVTDVDEIGPTITSSDAVNLAENVALSHSLTANESVTWTKTGGADAALFTLVGSTLSMTAKNFEIPVDADADNAYVVQITATDAILNATNQTITVTVTDVGEGGGTAGEPIGLLLALTKAT